jgi:hypothetical protein
MSETGLQALPKLRRSIKEVSPMEDGHTSTDATWTPTQELQINADAGYQGGEKMRVIENYKRAIENSDEGLLKEVCAPQVRIEIPAGASADHPVNKASYILSQVAKTAPGIACILTAEAGNNWYFLGFEGQIEGQKLQAVDQVHLNKDGKIDHLIIYMRPIPAAQKFSEAINQRLQPAR